MDIRTFTFEDIPKEFSLSNYDECINWKVKEWAAALAERMFARKILNMENRFRANQGTSDLQTILLERSLKMMLAPLHQPERVILPFNGRPTAIRDQSALTYFEGAFSLDDPRYSTFADLVRGMKMHYWDSPEVRKIEETLSAKKAWEMHRECDIRDDEGFVISVDLGASDEHLVDEFKQWLKSTRKAAGLSKIPRWYSESDFKKWCDLRFLAYLDLTYWAAVRDGHFTLPTLGTALFPSDYGKIGIEDRIRKVVAPGATAIVSEESVSALNAQRLKAERN